MRIFNLSLLVFMFFALLIVVFDNNPDIEPENVLNNLSRIHEATFNITNKIGYSNLYEEEITIKKVAYNVINPIIYGIVVEVNTFIPLATYVASGSYASVIMKYVIVIVILYLLVALPNLIKAIVSIYFFMKEKKRYKKKCKEKIWH